MGQVIEAKFGLDKEVEATRVRIERNLIEEGARCGDSADLMRLKAKVLMQLFADLTDGLSATRIQLIVPDSMTKAEREMLAQSVHSAIMDTVKDAIGHSFRVVSAHMLDLCTSRLKE